MKKRIVIIMLVLSMIFSVSANAIEVRRPVVYPDLSFANGEAVCDVLIEADYSDDEIEAYIELWEGGTFLMSWRVSGMEYVETSRTANASRGKTYTLIVYASINGNDLPLTDISRTYN